MIRLNQSNNSSSNFDPRNILDNKGLKMKKASTVIIEKDGMFLAINRDNSGFYGFPGGTHEPGESPEQTMIRECFEETGLKVNS